jgi:hypothetical protein
VNYNGKKLSKNKRSENLYAISTEKYDPHLLGSLYLMVDFYSQRISLRNHKDPTVTTEF